MPIIKSAKKRVRVSAKAAARNSKVKKALRQSIKDFQAALTAKNSAKATKSLSEVQSNLDSAVKKNIINKNKAARKKSQLAHYMKDSGIKLVASKTATKPKATKKTSAKIKKPAN